MSAAAGPKSEVVRHGHEREGRHHHLVGEAAEAHEGDDPVAHRRLRSTPGPTAATTPAISLPGTNGVAGFSW